jgi:recombination protein RecA
MRAEAKIIPLVPKLWRPIAPAPVEAPAWCLSEVAGRLTELVGGAGGAQLTLAFSLVADAEQRGEPVAWVGTQESAFYPPDVAESGIDLDALVVIRVKKRAEVARAADQLARSGAFGLLVVDLAGGVEVPPALESRLLGLAQKHATAIVFLSDEERGTRSRPLGSLVSLRAEVKRARAAPGKFLCTLEVMKDKRRTSEGMTWSHVEERRGPAGLR